MRGFTLLGNGMLELSITNLSGDPCTVLASPDLAHPATNWDGLGPLTPFGGDRYRFLDPASTSATQRFYMLRWP